jgi:xanthine/uracil/vitamin C permease (AzgA family)
MKIRSFEFNLRELAGSMGDFGTLFPLAIGYIVVCGVHPAGLLVMMGAANIATGLVYRLPMPIEPMKVIAVVAIAQQWSPSMVYASAFGMGVIWLLLAVTGAINWLGAVTPHSVIRGIQVALGALLLMEALKTLATGWIVGIVAVVIVLALRQNRYAPAAIVLVGLGVVIMLIRGEFQQVQSPSFALPERASFSLAEVWQTLLLAGFAQIPLTVTNATLSTCSLIHTYWPERRVSERQLSWNQGVMNVVVPFFGGMPMCHGAGGLAGQYYYGARTGGANIIEGVIEIFLGLFLAGSVVALLAGFPTAIIGGMMFLVGIELIKFARDVRLDKDVVPLGATVLVSLATNMAYGFVAGLALYYLSQWITSKVRTAV